MTIEGNQRSSSSSEPLSKIKIPINCSFGVNQEAGGSSTSADQNVDINTSGRVCPECHKEFDSGKALGGHMRIHGPSNKKQLMLRIHHPGSNSEGSLMYDCTFNCILCLRKFPSVKALCGHMRCHSGRGWTGTRPPTKRKSSSLLAEDDDDEKDYGDDGARVVDSAQLIPKWPVKARRGGRGVSKAMSELLVGCDNEEMRSLIRNALEVLTMLSQVLDYDVDGAGAGAGAGDGAEKSVSAFAPPDQRFDRTRERRNWTDPADDDTQTEAQALPQPQAQLGVGSSGEEGGTQGGGKRIRLMGFDLNVPASMVDDAD